MKKLILFIILTNILNISCFAAQKKLLLLIPEYKPYTYSEKNGTFKGIGIEIIKTLMKEIGVEYTLKSVPNHTRAFMDVKSGKADGFFLASKNFERDEYCEFSEFVLSNRWCWFLLANNKLDPKSNSFRKTAKIGTMLNTNHQTWLEERKYNIVSTPNDITAPPKILKLKRADAFFMSESVFWSGVDETEKDDFRSIVEVENPLGIYISKQFLKDNPNFMNKLNKAIIKNRTSFEKNNFF